MYLYVSADDDGTEVVFYRSDEEYVECFTANHDEFGLGLLIEY